MYYSDKPANIIATNSMFILDEYADLKSIQVGGTLSWDPVYENFLGNRGDTYLYLKGVDNNDEIAYLKIIIKPSEKAILEPGMSSMSGDENGKIFTKTIDYYIKIVQIPTLNFSGECSSNNSDWLCSYTTCFDDQNGVQYCNVELMLENIKSRNPYISSIKLVKKPDVHHLLCENIFEY